jgi:hypothetical protein
VLGFEIDDIGRNMVAMGNQVIEGSKRTLLILRHNAKCKILGVLNATYFNKY